MENSDSNPAGLTPRRWASICSLAGPALFPGGPGAVPWRAIRSPYYIISLLLSYILRYMPQAHRDEDDAFLQQFVLSEEDRQRPHPTTRWTGGFRWFRSDNVIRLELYRDQAAMNRIIGVILNPARVLPTEIATMPAAPAHCDKPI